MFIPEAQPIRKGAACTSFSGVIIGHAVRGAPVSRLGLPSVVVGSDIGTGALECEEAGRLF